MKNILVFCGILLFWAVANGQDGTAESPVTDGTVDSPAESATSQEESTTGNTPPSTTPSVPEPPAPTSDPDREPKRGKYHLTDKDTNVTCIVLDACIRFNFTYTKNKSDNTTKEVVIQYDLPPDNTTVSGKCSNHNQSDYEVINLTFFDSTLTLEFNKTKDDDYSITKATLRYLMNDHWFPNTAEETGDMTSSKNKVNQFQVDSGKSLKCASKVNIDEFSGGNLKNIYTWDVQVEAFRSKKNNTDFADAMYCDADTKVSNLVPIIVGAALAGLVLIVLVAYLIGRTRNKRGYESV